MVPVPFGGTGTTALHLTEGSRTETRDQVVARVTAAVDGAADGAFGFDRPNPVTDPGTLAVEYVWCAGRRVS